MDIVRLLSKDTSSPLAMIEPQANPPSPVRSPVPLLSAPQYSSDKEILDSDLEEVSLLFLRLLDVLISLSTPSSRLVLLTNHPSL